MRKTVLSFGEALWDLLPDARKLGGAPLNLAYRVNCLGDRGIVVSRLGRDELGREAWDLIRSLGLDTALLQWDDAYPTGTVNVTLDADRISDIHIVPGAAYDHIEAMPALLNAARSADCVCFGTLAQRTPVSRETLARLLDAARKSIRLLDINLRRNCFSKETVAASLQEAHILRCNEDETAAMSKLLDIGSHDVVSFCDRVIERWSLTHCLVTLGERGAYAASADGLVSAEGRAVAGRKVYVPGYKVNVVDPLGSGDAFTAGFIHRFLRTNDLAECIALGNAMGAIVATQRGATEPITETAMEEFLAADHTRNFDPLLRQYAVA